MTKQAQNFIELTKGNSVSQIISALKLVKQSVKNELMEHYNVSTIDELAFKLS